MDFRKVGLAVIQGGRILLCRKNNGLPYLILPGGKANPGESSLDCLHREIQEELGPVTATNLRYFGTYTSPAAVAPGAPPAIIEIELYLGELIGEPIASGEIAQLIWFDLSGDRALLAPSLANLIVPDLSALSRRHDTV
ncbi:MAG TPA: NUDIX domain-containing protein [Bryobacteraceae bacterium]|jgi:8-oxo-dGTP pyrophosphatase MutT (NUDIX family)|nr:NUDIX domain-containing protein [Bryobacteraceae bacterium]